MACGDYTVGQPPAATDFDNFAQPLWIVAMFFSPFPFSQASGQVTVTTGFGELIFTVDFTIPGDKVFLFNPPLKIIGTDVSYTFPASWSTGGNEVDTRTILSTDPTVLAVPMLILFPAPGDEEPTNLVTVVGEDIPTSCAWMQSSTVSGGVIVAEALASGFSITIDGTPFDGVSNLHHQIALSLGAHPASNCQAGGIDGQTFVLIQLPTTLAVSCNNPPAAQLGVAYSHTITASGGTAPYVFAITAGSLPPGLTLDSASGVISGTLTDSVVRGSYAFTVRVTDSASATAQVDCSISIPVGYVPVDNVWESGLARGNELSASMIRLAAFDVWVRGAGPLSNTVYGPDKVLSQTPQLLLASGVPATALATNPGIMYALKLDFRQIENFTIRFESDTLDGWFELSGFRTYTKSDLYNR